MKAVCTELFCEATGAGLGVPEPVLLPFPAPVVTAGREGAGTRILENISGAVVGKYRRTTLIERGICNAQSVLAVIGIGPIGQGNSGAIACRIHTVCSIVGRCHRV